MAIEKLTVEDALTIQRNECQAEIAELLIDTSILEKQDPKMVVARKKLTDNSYTELTTEKFLPSKLKELELKQVRLSAIDVLLTKNKNK